MRHGLRKQLVGVFLVIGGALWGAYSDATSAALLGLDAARAPAWEFQHEEFAVTGGVAVLRVRLSRTQDGVPITAPCPGRLRLLGAAAPDGTYRELADAEVDNPDFAAGEVAEIRYLMPRKNRPAAFKAAIGPGSFVPGRYADLAAGEYAWLLAQQLPNGAIAKVNDAATVSVNPYFALEAVMGLLRGWPTAESRAAARRYFDWHLAHLNTAAQDYSGHDGTIYDYTVEQTRAGGSILREFPTPTPPTALREGESAHPLYDSADSYAALLLVAMADYARTPAGAAYAREHAADLLRVWNALDACFDPSGFTHARLDYYNIQYLMDNCEVYAGLVAAEFLFGETLGDATRADAAASRRAVFDSRFRSAFVEDDHFRTETRNSSFDWTNFYPSQTAPLFPVAYGVLSPADELASTMHTNLCNHLSWWRRDWEDVFHWTLTATYGAKMGDARTYQYVDEYARRAAADHSYTNGFHCGESGLMLSAFGVARDFFTTVETPLVEAVDGPYTRQTALMDTLRGDAEVLDCEVDEFGRPVNATVCFMQDHVGTVFIPDDMGFVQMELLGHTIVGSQGASGTAANPAGGKGLPAVALVPGLPDVVVEAERKPVAEPPLDAPPASLDFVPGDYLVVDLDDGSVTGVNGVLSANTFNTEAYKTSKIAFRMVPAGSFRMQVGEPFANRGEGSVVTLMEDYWIAVFPLTQAQCRRLYPQMPSQNYGLGEMRPAHLMSWHQFNDAVAELDELVEPAGFHAALSNEAQWERALRAGTTNLYFFGETATDLARYAWYGDRPDGESGVKTVGRLQPNPWGLYDMLGNVWEWCSDHYYSFYADCQPGGPTVPYPYAYNRSTRGGSYSHGEDNCASTYRGSGNPEDAWIIGARPVLTRRPVETTRWLPGISTVLMIMNRGGEEEGWLVGGRGGNGDPVGEGGEAMTSQGSVRSNASVALSCPMTSGDAGAPVKGAAASIEISAFGVGATDVTLVADIALKADYPFSFADWLRDARRMECLRVWSGGTPGRWETAHVPEEASIVRQQGNAGVGASVELRVPRTADDALFYKVEVGNDAAR